MRKLLLVGVVAISALTLSSRSPAWAIDPCVDLCDGSSSSTSLGGTGIGGAGGSATQGQYQGQDQGQGQHQTAAGGLGGQGGAGGQGGKAVAIGGGGGNAYNGGQSNNQSTVFQSSGFAPAMTAVPPGLTGGIGFGVCATQDSHSDGIGVGVGVIGPSAGLNFSHGNTNTSENLQCDYGRTVQAVCQLNPNFVLKGKHTAGQVCAHVMAKLAGVQESFLELDQEDAQAAKQEKTVRASIGWHTCDWSGCH